MNGKWQRGARMRNIFIVIGVQNGHVGLILCENSSWISIRRGEKSFAPTCLAELLALNERLNSVGTSKLEGKIKIIKRKAYGFHDDRYFALKVKQALPGKNSTTEIG